MPEGQRPVPVAAIAGLTAIGDHAVPDLTKVLEAGDGWPALFAVDAIAEMGAGAKPAIPALVKALEGKDQWKVTYVAKALEQIGPHASDAVPALLEMIRKKKPGRTAAIGVVGALKPDTKTVVPLLAGIAKDAQEDAADRVQAIVSLAYMGVRSDPAGPHRSRGIRASGCRGR